MILSPTQSNEFKVDQVETPKKFKVFRSNDDNPISIDRAKKSRLKAPGARAVVTQEYTDQTVDGSDDRTSQEIYESVQKRHLKRRRKTRNSNASLTNQLVENVKVARSVGGSVQKGIIHSFLNNNRRTDELPQ